MSVEDEIIDSILVDGQGWKYRSQGEFEFTGKCGEMAMVPWIMQHTKEGLIEFNCKYIVQINYVNE